MSARNPLDLALELVAERPESLTRLRVEGMSMSPLLETGDVVYFSPARFSPPRPDDLHPGDLVVLRRTDHLLTHRFLKATPAGLLTKGDHVHQFDLLAEPGQVVGKVSWAQRTGEQPFSLLRPPWGRLNPWLVWLSTWQGNLSARGGGWGARLSLRGLGWGLRALVRLARFAARRRTPGPPQFPRM